MAGRAKLPMLHILFCSVACELKKGAFGRNDLILSRSKFSGQLHAGNVSITRKWGTDVAIESNACGLIRITCSRRFRMAHLPGEGSILTLYDYPSMRFRTPDANGFVLETRAETGVMWYRSLHREAALLNIRRTEAFFANDDQLWDMTVRMTREQKELAILIFSYDLAGKEDQPAMRKRVVAKLDAMSHDSQWWIDRRLCGGVLIPRDVSTGDP